MPRGGWRPGAGRKKKVPGVIPSALPQRLTAPAPDRKRALRAREHAAVFLESREDALIEEVWTTGTLRDRLELYRFLKPYSDGVAKLPAESALQTPTFESIMAMIAREKQVAEELERRKAEAIETTVETVKVEQVREGQNSGR